MADWPKEVHEQYLRVLEERDVAQEKVDILSEAIRNMLDLATGWTAISTPEGRLTRIEMIGNDALDVTQAMRPMTRVIICGSRGWFDRQRIADRIADLPSDTVVVHGAQKGADRIAEQEAQKAGLLVEPWRYRDFIGPGVSPKIAPLVRNEHMASLGADLCIAFWDGRSTGTAHMMEKAAKYGIPIEVQHKDFPNREYMRSAEGTPSDHGSGSASTGGRSGSSPGSASNTQETASGFKPRREDEQT